MRSVYINISSMPYSCTDLKKRNSMGTIPYCNTKYGLQINASYGIIQANVLCSF